MKETGNRRDSSYSRSSRDRDDRRSFHRRENSSPRRDKHHHHHAKSERNEGRSEYRNIAERDMPTRHSSAVVGSASRETRNAHKPEKVDPSHSVSTEIPVHSKPSGTPPSSAEAEADKGTPEQVGAAKKRKNSAPSRLSFSDDLDEGGGADSEGSELSMSRATAQRFKKERLQKRATPHDILDLISPQSVLQQSSATPAGSTSSTVADISSILEHLGTHGAPGEWWQCVDDDRSRPGRVVDDDDEDNAAWKQVLRVRHGVSAKQGRRPYMEDTNFSIR
jgi:hypothetical protein